MISKEDVTRKEAVPAKFNRDPVGIFYDRENLTPCCKNFMNSPTVPDQKSNGKKTHKVVAVDAIIGQAMRLAALAYATFVSSPSLRYRSANSTVTIAPSTNIPTTKIRENKPNLVKRNGKMHFGSTGECYGFGYVASYNATCAEKGQSTDTDSTPPSHRFNCMQDVQTHRRRKKMLSDNNW